MFVGNMYVAILLVLTSGLSGTEPPCKKVKVHQKDAILDQSCDAGMGNLTLDAERKEKAWMKFVMPIYPDPAAPIDGWVDEAYLMGVQNDSALGMLCVIPTYMSWHREGDMEEMSAVTAAPYEHELYAAFCAWKKHRDELPFDSQDPRLMMRNEVTPQSKVALFALPRLISLVRDNRLVYACSTSDVYHKAQSESDVFLYPQTTLCEVGAGIESWHGKLPKIQKQLVARREHLRFERSKVAPVVYLNRGKHRRISTQEAEIDTEVEQLNEFIALLDEFSHVYKHSSLPGELRACQEGGPLPMLWPKNMPLAAGVMTAEEVHGKRRASEHDG